MKSSENLALAFATSAAERGLAIGRHYQDLLASRRTTALVVRDLSTKEEIHRCPITGDKSEDQIDRVESGMLMRIDTDRYYLDREYSKQGQGS